MSYMKKNRFGQYFAVGDTDPWASTSESSTPASAPSGGSVFDAFKDMFSTTGGTIASAGGAVASGGGTVAGGTPTKPSTLTNVGAGIGAFLKNLGGGPVAPTGVVYPVQRPGLSTGAKLALAGGGALLLVLLLKD